MAHANAKLTIYGRRLIIERWEAGWTQAEVAESLGVSRSTVATVSYTHLTLPTIYSV